jgi:hypothetical protein
MDTIEEIEFKLKNIPPELKGQDREDYRNRLYSKRRRVKKKMRWQAPVTAEILEAERKLAELIKKYMDAGFASKVGTSQARIIIARQGSEEAKRLSDLVAKF